MPPIALAVSAGLALAAAGCGSSGLSDAAFTSKANAICASGNAAANSLSQSGSGLALTGEEKIVSTTLSKLEALSPPSNRAGAFHSYLAVYRQLQALLRTEANAVATRNTAKMTTVERTATGIIAKADAQAKAAGITACD